MGRTSKAEVMLALRQICGAGPVPKEELLRQLARMHGHQRIGKHIRRELESHLNAAVRRGIIERTSNGYALIFRRLEDYDRNFLKDQFLGAIGRKWVEREEAIRVFTRWMGYARTSEGMMEVGRSLINGLLRTQELESEGKEMIRKVCTNPK